MEELQISEWTLNYFIRNLTIDEKRYKNLN